MKNYIGLYNKIFAFLLFSNIAIFSQAQLLQSFIEQNEIGANPNFGQMVSNAGDVNNDGFDDIIVATGNFNSSQHRVYIYYGGNPTDNIVDVIINGISSIQSISNAGDVNNDGFDDIIIGFPSPVSSLGSPLPGSANIYYGGNPMDNASDVYFSGENNGDEFGSSVSNAGDVNNDGFDDVIIGAPKHNLSTGRGYIFYGGSSMDNNVDVTLTGNFADDLFGSSVTSAGDVNNDGFDDVVVNAYGFNSNTGRIMVYYGGSFMDSFPEVIIDGQTSSGYFGFLISAAGDVNNDGFDDLVASSPIDSSAFLFLGGSSMDNISDVEFIGNDLNDLIGYSVSNAGDVNNDGFDDVILGAFNSGSGSAYIYLGGSVMDPIPDILFTGENTSDSYGASVSSAGDINNDGFDDIIVGASRYNGQIGRAYIYYGHSSMDNSADMTLSPQGLANLFGTSASSAGDVNNDGYDDIIVSARSNNYFRGRVYIYYGGNIMDDVADVILNGENSYDSFGISVSKAGDVNNDGFDDVVVGAYGYEPGGRAYVYFGGNNMNTTADVIIDPVENTGDQFGLDVTNAGDLNNDGFDDIVIIDLNYTNGNNYDMLVYVYYGGSNMDATVDLTFNEESSVVSTRSVSTAGDVNNDGFDDLIIGERNNTIGNAYIYYGGSSMNTVADITLTGETTNDEYGAAVSTAGDVNNDGFDDVVVGAYRYNSSFGVQGNGRAYVYLGGNVMNSTADVIITGENTFSFLGRSVSTAGDVNNDGYDDIIISQKNNNSGNTRANIYYGGNSMDNLGDVLILDEVENSYDFVTTAGDINSDGYAEVLITNSVYPFNGKVYIYTDPSAPTSFESEILTKDVPADLTFPRAGINLKLLPSKDGTISVSKFDFEPTLGSFSGVTGINTTISTHWDVNGKARFENGLICISLTTLAEIAPNLNPDNLVWLTREYSGGDWTSLGGVIEGGTNFVNFIPFNSTANDFSFEFTIGYYTGELELLVLLEGPFTPTGMNNILGSSIPTQHPYGGSPWNHTLEESTTESVLNDEFVFVVDWVLIELRTENISGDPTEIVKKKAALVNRFGQVYDVDGTINVKFSGISSGDYYIAVYHRNHLPVISSSAVSL
jgi:hypothetical protein